MRIPFVNLKAQHENIKEEAMELLEEVFLSGQFILGDQLKEFENNFASYCNSKYAVGVASGTDAIVLSLKVLGIGPGDEVITAPNSFLASSSSIIIAGARPVFVDISDDGNIDPEKIEKAINDNTKAILPIHLSGIPSKMDYIQDIAERHNLFVVEDAAQSIGAEYFGKKTGSFGQCGAFSLHPLKNLGAAGDGGIIVTDSESIYNKLLLLRNHGLRDRNNCEIWSYNSRLDNIQAAILNVKFKYLNKWQKRRKEIAEKYSLLLKGVVDLPQTIEGIIHSNNAFVIKAKKRDELQTFLIDQGIDAKVNYPVPLHLQKAASELNYKKGDFLEAEYQAQHILSLPIFPELDDDAVQYVSEKILEFHKLK